MEAEFAAWEAALPTEEENARPVDPPRGHSRPGNDVSVTWEIASTLGAKTWPWATRQKLSGWSPTAGRGSAVTPTGNGYSRRR